MDGRGVWIAVKVYDVENLLAVFKETEIPHFSLFLTDIR